jgi:hypothetical protein
MHAQRDVDGGSEKWWTRIRRRDMKSEGGLGVGREASGKTASTGSRGCDVMEQ